MRFLYFLLFILFYSLQVSAQVEEPPTEVEQQLENITEGNEDMETEDDSYLQELNYLLKDPLNLNYASRQQLEAIRFLTPMQVESLIQYRNYLGLLIHLYELQAVPGWDIETILKLRPFITVSRSANIKNSIGDRLSGGDKSILVRAIQVLEQSRGYLADSAGATGNRYLGSPQRLLLRYRYKYKNLLQYGVLAEKDAGEELFKGSQKSGFDFYSAHFFMRNSGMVKALALGDYTVNLGQGLTQWMSMAYKKGPDVMSTKRQSEVLRPYSSPGEVFFFRGAGITVGKKNWEATVFASYKKVDANFIGDTSNNVEEYITSFQTSGYHRTPGEIADKGAQGQMAFGGNIGLHFKGLQLDINAIQFDMKYPLQKSEQPYNRYALSGNSFGNYSVDYSYTHRNLHFFGEAAMSSKQYFAFVNGFMISTSRNVDMSFLYRNISKGYQTLYGAAFTENSMPTNEKGFFAGISIKPSQAWKIDAYSDIFRFPWLKFGVDAPSSGSEYFVQVSYRPNKQLDMYSRYKVESKGTNFNPGSLPMKPIINMPKQSLRYQVAFKVSPEITLRSRTEMSWYDKRGEAASEGFLLYVDFFYKPMMKRISGNLRLQYFETDDYNSRLYAFENDLLYNYAIPVFYESGYRYYLNVNYDVNKKLAFWLKLAQTLYNKRESIGSGLDEIQGRHRTELKMQMMYNF